MFKKYLLFIFLSLSFGMIYGQQLNVERGGRWAEGPNKAIFRRQYFTFVGNGAYLQVYLDKHDGNFEFYKEILLPGAVQDIWVVSNLQTIYVACGKAGLQIVQMDTLTRTLTRIREVSVNGFAGGVGHFFKHAYVAAGENGMVIVNVDNIYNPYIEGRFPTNHPARDVWVVHDSLTLVAADLSGIFAVTTRVKDNPTLLDSLDFQNVFGGFQIPDPKAQSLFTIGSMAYIAAGYGGLRMVDISNPEVLTETGRWTDSVPRDVKDIQLTGSDIYLVCGYDGLFGPIDVSNPANPGSLIFPPLDTDGYSSKIWITGDTAYVCDGPSGLQLVNISEGNQPEIIRNLPASGNAYDTDTYGEYAFLAAGQAGLKIFNLNFDESTENHLSVLGKYNTPGEVRGLQIKNEFAFLADGSKGLHVVDILNKSNPVFYGQYTTIGDTCYDVAVYNENSSSYALLACGKIGLVVINYSGFEFFKIQELNTPGSAKKIEIQGHRAFLADSSGVYVYNIIDLPDLPQQTHSLTTNMDAYSMAAVGDTLFIANGQYGLLVWNLLTNSVTRFTTGGLITDVQVVEKTLYLTDAESGLRVLDFSTPGLFQETGYYRTQGTPNGISVSTTNRIVMADGNDGLYVFSSAIKPDIAYYPASPLEFGPVPPGETRSRWLRFVNEGTTQLRVQNIQWLNAMYSFSETSFSVAPGDTHRIKITFTPVAGVGELPQIDNAFIYSNDPDESTVELTLQGRIAMLVTEGAYVQDEFTTGLYHMDDAVVTTVVEDASIYHQTAQVLGSPEQVNSRSGFNKALYLNGENDYLLIPYHAPLNTYKSPFTIELWFNISVKPEGYALLMRRGNDTSRQVELALDNTTEKGLIGSIWTAGGRQIQVASGSMSLLNTGQWYHAALTWDTDSLKLFLNGDQVNQASISGQLRSQLSEPMAIGATSTGLIPFNGTIDEVRISNIAREPWEFHVNRARIAIQPAIIEFGQVLFGQSRRVPVTLTNRGAQLLTIQNISTAYSSILVEANLPISLPPNASSVFWATYSPQQENDHADSKTLTILSSDPTYPQIAVLMQGRAVSTFQAGAYQTDPFTLGLYHFDDNHLTVASDSSGYGMDGIFSGAVAYDGEQKKFGTGFSVKFKPSNERIRITPKPENILYDKWGGFTVETWFRLEVFPVTQSVLIRRGNIAANQFDLYIDNSGRIIGRMYNNTQDLFEVNSAELGVVQLNQWYHVAMIQRRDSLYLYINGNEVDKNGFVGPMASEKNYTFMDTLSVLVGGDWGIAYPFAGNMDEIRISGIGRESWEFNVNMARITVSPAMLNFGDVYLGSARTLELTINNNLGIDTLIVDSVHIDLSTYFSTDLIPFKLAPGASKRLRVVYSALNQGTHQGKLTFFTNDPFWPERQVNLSGKGIPVVNQIAYQTDPFTLSLFHLDTVGEDGVTVGDSSGTGIHGKLLGDVALSDTGRFDKSLRFKDGAFEIPYQALQNKISAFFTIETWFQLTEKPQSDALIVQRETGGKRQFEITITSGENGSVMARLWNKQELGFTLKGTRLDALNTGQWYHIALSIDGSWTRLMLNGLVEDSTEFIGDILELNEGAVRFGRDTSGQRQFIGFMDEIRLSNIYRKSWELNVIPPQIVVSNVQLAFEDVKMGFTRTLDVLIRNLGDQTLKITSIQGADSIFSIPDAYKSFSIFRSDSMYLPISFKPAEVNVDYQYTFKLNSNAKNSPVLSLLLSGSGYENPGAVEYISDIYTIGLYHFDESQGDTIFDSSGNGFNGYLWNGARIISGDGYIGGGIRFDGYNDRVEIPGRSIFQNNLKEQSLTLECYFRTDTLSQVLIGMGYPDSLMMGDFIISINELGKLSINGEEGSGPRINDNAWHHMAFVYDARTRTGSAFIDWKMIWTKNWDINLPDHETIRPLILGASERKTGGYSGYFQGSLDEFRFSSINREIWNFNAPIDAGIKILTSVPAAPVAGEPVTINIQIPYEVNPSSVTVNYRSAGLSAYESVNALPENDTQFKATIPQEAVTLRGLEFYIRTVSETQKTYTFPIIDPVHNPHTMPIRFDMMSTSLKYSAQKQESGKYQLAALFSVPFLLDPIGADTLLNTTLDTYDRFQWRLFWWDPERSNVWYRFDPEGDVYVEYSESEKYYFSMPPGRAYWLVSNIERSFPLQSGQTVSTDTSFQKKLLPGWNLIGNPFNFTIKWADCAVSSRFVTPPYAFLGLDGYEPDTPLLEPWKGYWLYNSTDQPQFVYIQPADAGLSKSAPHENQINENLDEADWLLQLSADGRETRDLYNFIGIRKGASDHFDMFDRFEPPPFGTAITMYVDHSDWEERQGKYAADLRKVNTEGQFWNLNVESAESQEDVRITWQMKQDIPDDWQIFLIDPEDEVAVNMSENGLYTFQLNAVQMKRGLKIIAGTQAYLEENRDGISLEPVAFMLYPNAPNPFNPVTALRFSLPKKSDVEIQIFNALGQRVKQILRKACHAGHHEIIWDGTNDAGMKLASGIYVYQLKGVNKTATRKMILLK